MRSLLMFALPRITRRARWVMFREGRLTDYTPRLAELAEPVPAGTSCQRMMKLAEDLNCHISFGMSERDGIRVYISRLLGDHDTIQGVLEVVLT